MDVLVLLGRRAIMFIIKINTIVFFNKPILDLKIKNYNYHMKTRNTKIWVICGKHFLSSIHINIIDKIVF